MSINNNPLTKVPVWQGFSGRNQLNSHSTPRPAAPASGFLLTALSNAPKRSVSPPASREGAPPIKH